MFTKRDYNRYFEQLADVERKKIYSVNDMLIRLTDPQIINTFKQIVDDAVKQYANIFNVYSDLIGSSEYMEQRLGRRGHSLGEVELKLFPQEPGRAFRGYCVNLSQGGLCLESTYPFRMGDRFDIKVRLFDRPEELIERKGKIVWKKEVVSDLHIGGIMFEK